MQGRKLGAVSWLLQGWALLHRVVALSLAPHQPQPQPPAPSPSLPLPHRRPAQPLVHAHCGHPGRWSPLQAMAAFRGWQRATALSPREGWHVWEPMVVGSA